MVSCASSFSEACLGLVDLCFQYVFKSFHNDFQHYLAWVTN